MKNKIFNLFLVIILTLTACSEEIKIKEFNNIWKWNMKDNPTRMCGFDKSLSDADQIIIFVESDYGEVYNLTNYSFDENLLTIYAPIEFQTEDFDDPDLARLRTKIIWLD